LKHETFDYMFFYRNVKSWKVLGCFKS